jgi:F-type H+-transporting ATPase subunit epsilon
VAAQFSFELITPDGLIYQAEAFQVVLPTADGQITVLAHHQALLTLIVPGVIVVNQNDYIATSGGFAEISGKRVRLLTDNAERSEHIDELAAQEALRRAQDMREHAKDKISLADATALIEQQSVRLKVAQLRRRKR